MWTTKYQAELRQLNGTSQVSPPSIFSGEMAWGRTRWFRLIYRCCIISCYNSFIACLIMTLIVIASNYLRLRANSYNPLLIPFLHTRILEQITMVWLRPPQTPRSNLQNCDVKTKLSVTRCFSTEFAQTFPVQSSFLQQMMQRECRFLFSTNCFLLAKPPRCHDVCDRKIPLESRWIWALRSTYL